jgi:hypothetical protein
MTDFPNSTEIVAAAHEWGHCYADLQRLSALAWAGKAYLAERRSRAPRRPPLDTLLKQAAKAGKSVKGVEVYQDRTVLQFGEPAPVEPENPWPLDEFRTKETKQ